MIKRLLIFLVMPFLALSGKLYGQDTAYTFPDGYSAGGRPIRSSISSPHNMSARVNLILLQETMKFLSRTGGVESWQKIFKKR